jgi:hypothetical protein
MEQNGWNAAQWINRFFAWHRHHHITGVEVMHVPLLLISAYVMGTLDQLERSQGLFHTLNDVMVYWLWSAVLLSITAALLVSLLFGRAHLHRLSLSLVASWWFLVALLIWRSGSTWLTPAIYSSIGLSAIYRVGDQAFRETMRDG